MAKVIPPGRRRGMVTVPSSKSIAHRELIAAALSGVEAPVIRGESDDLVATRNCLAAMLAGKPEWPCGESATTLRLLEPLAGVLGLAGSFKCGERLAGRPRMPFVKRTRHIVPGNLSSQFVSGLLMALPLAGWDSEIVVDGELQSAPYVRLTENVLTAAGIVFERLPHWGWKVPGNQRYRIDGGREVEGDWSQAAFFLAMGVEVSGVKADSAQGDRAIVEDLRRLDHGPDGLILDVADTPDLYPVLAAYAAATGRKATFTGTNRLRLKESDRLESTAKMIEAVRNGETVKTFGDHRIAMAAAVMACYAEKPVVLDDPDCVAKSYPRFWDDFEALEIMA